VVIIIVASAVSLAVALLTLYRLNNAQRDQGTPAGLQM
jgi:hypothetical protein